MTAAELNRQIEVSEQQRADLLPPQSKRQMGRAYRRMMNERKFKHLFIIVTHGYRPHAGYVDWSYVDGKPLLDKGGVFVHLRKYENFARVFIEYGAVCWDIDPNVDSNEVWNNRIDLCPDSCYIDNIPACAKGLTRDDMLRAKEAMLEMGIDIKDEDAVAGFAVSRKVLGLDRRKK